jgi:peptidyl-prolyl cis-trans isomerase A (cyclophilin A)
MILAAAFLLLAAPPASAAAPVVLLHTTLGDIKLELDEKRAPVSTENFLAYVAAKHYDGTIFHRVIPGFMIQGGGMDSGLAIRGTRAPIKNEHGNGLTNERGTVAMARTNDPNSATCQFFINLQDNPALDRDAGYAVFGRVVSGMDVVDKIAQVRTTTKGVNQNVPAMPVVIEKASRLDAPRSTAPVAEPRPRAGAEDKAAPRPAP